MRYLLAAFLISTGLISGAIAQEVPDLPETRRAPLLREGSQLIKAMARVQPGPRPGTLDVVVDGPTAESPPHTLTLLPNTALTELSLVIAAAEDGAAPTVEVSGKVYVYREHNFLLLTQPAIVRMSAVEEPAEPSEPDTEDDSVDSIIESIEHAVDPIVPRPDVEPIGHGRLVVEGTKVVRRRGTVRRTPTGAFVFAFDADSSGLADPPMTVLPCLLLERMDRYLRRAAERQATMLLTGQVFTYGERNYLLPTVFQLPRDRTPLAVR